MFATEQKSSTLEFRTDGIVKIIKSLDPKKAHGHNEISIRMIKLCATSIANLCQFSLVTVFRINVSPKNGRKPTLYLFIKKNDKQLIKNYRPESLLPVCGKIYEKIIFNSLF